MHGHTPATRKKSTLRQKSLAQLKDKVRRYNARTTIPARRIQVQQTRKQLIKSILKVQKKRKKQKTRRLVTARPSTKELIPVRQLENERVQHVLQGLPLHSRAVLTRALNQYGKKVAKRTARREKVLAHHDRYGPEHRQTYNVLKERLGAAYPADHITMFVKGMDAREKVIDRKIAQVRAAQTRAIQQHVDNTTGVTRPRMLRILERLHYRQTRKLARRAHELEKERRRLQPKNAYDLGSLSPILEES